MRNVAPRIGWPESSIAEDQHEYLVVVGAHVDLPQGKAVTTRWRPSDEDLARLNAGEHVYLTMLTFGRPLQPFRVEVGPPEFTREEDAG